VQHSVVQQYTALHYTVQRKVQRKVRHYTAQHYTAQRLAGRPTYLPEADERDEHEQELHRDQRQPAVHPHPALSLKPCGV
jgi:hypothetical protein